MGNQQTNVNTSNNDNNINFDKNELKILYQNFTKMDVDHTGFLEPNEFFDVPELKDNPIVNRIVKVFDKNGDEKISFYEFVFGLSTLASQGNVEEKNKLAFAIYDMDGDGYLSNGDLFKCLRLLVGDNLTEVQVQQLVDRTIISADKDMDGKISLEEFCDFVKDMKIDEMFSVNLFGLK